MLWSMSRPTITPRKPRFDLSEVPRHWFGGHRLATHIANGVNVLFPTGERFFVRSVHHFLDHPAVQADPELVAQVKGFAGQEGKHARVHEDYNEMLRKHGYPIDRWLSKHDRWMYGWLEPRMKPEVKLAATAAAEHFTAIMAENAFRQQVLAHAHPVMRDLLQWHAAEEIEHKSVAFDVLQKVNPSYALRMAGMFFASITLGAWWLVGTINLLRADKMTLEDLRTEANQLKQTRNDNDGIAKNVFARGIREYLRRDFHPSQNVNEHLAAEYLERSGMNAYAVS
jgi:uncharacterized protein